MELFRLCIILAYLLELCFAERWNAFLIHGNNSGRSLNTSRAFCQSCTPSDISARLQAYHRNFGKLLVTQDDMLEDDLQQLVFRIDSPETFGFFRSKWANRLLHSPDIIKAFSIRVEQLFKKKSSRLSHKITDSFEVKVFVDKAFRISAEMFVTNFIGIDDGLGVLVRSSDGMIIQPSLFSFGSDESVEIYDEMIIHPSMPTFGSVESVGFSDEMIIQPSMPTFGSVESPRSSDDMVMQPSPPSLEIKPVRITLGRPLHTLIKSESGQSPTNYIRLNTFNFSQVSPVISTLNCISNETLITFSPRYLERPLSSINYYKLKVSMVSGKQRLCDRMTEAALTFYEIASKLNIIEAISFCHLSKSKFEVKFYFVGSDADIPTRYIFRSLLLDFGLTGQLTLFTPPPVCPPELEIRLSVLYPDGSAFTRFYKNSFELLTSKNRVYRSNKYVFRFPDYTTDSDALYAENWILKPLPKCNQSKVFPKSVLDVLYHFLNNLGRTDFPYCSFTFLITPDKILHISLHAYEIPSHDFPLGDQDFTDEYKCIRVSRKFDDSDL